MISNQSNVKITGTKFILLQLLCYQCQSPVKKIHVKTKEIAIKRGDGVNKMQNKIIESTIAVPMGTPPTSFSRDCIILWKYVIRSIVKTKGVVHRSIVIDNPIVIGTIQMATSDLQANLHFIPPLPGFSPRPVGFVMPTAPKIFEDAPPSYEESTKGIVEPVTSPEKSNLN